jgi:hydroxymethylbilane synthase
MWQAQTVMNFLINLYRDLEIEIVKVKTTGDAIQDVALSKLPGKAFFTKEIEEALSDDRIDLAVHSGKDVPTSLPDGLRLAGFLKRHSPNDALICNGRFGFEDLPHGSRVGTSSIRRRSLLAYLRPDLEILDLRGNVDTRLKKLDQGMYDAIVLAAAGLDRLGFSDRISERLDLDRFPPAVSQGAMAMEIRHGDTELLDLLKPITDMDTIAAVTAERALLETLEGGCQVPLGALGTVKDKNLLLKASIVAPDGSLRVDGSMEAPVENAQDLGNALASKLIDEGGDKILAMVRNR